MSSINAVDSITWSQLGESYASLSGAQSVTSGKGVNATVTSAGNTFQRRDQGNGWIGTFASGEALLWTAGVGPDITLTFDKAVNAVGAYLAADYYGPFTAQIMGGNGELLGSYSAEGNSGQYNAFVGLQSSAYDIKSVTFSLSNATNAPNDFAIGTVQLGGVSTVPLPASAPMFGAALLGLAGLSLAAKRKVKATA